MHKKRVDGACFFYAAKVNRHESLIDARFIH